MRAIAIVVVACAACTSKPVEYIAPFVQLHVIGDGTSDTFSATAAAGDAVVMLVGCEAGTTPPASVTIDASGWTFTMTSSLVAAGPLWAASFVAFAPDDHAATFTATWSSSCMRRIAIGDEFAGVASEPESYATSCTTTAVPAARDAVWAACYSNGGVVAPGAGFAKGADDSFGDWSEYALAPAPENVAFELAGASSEIATVALLRPR